MQTSTSEPGTSANVVQLRRAVAFVVHLSAFLGPFMAASLNICLPDMGHDLVMGASTLTWVASSYLLAAAVFTVPFGRLADIYGRRRVLLYGDIVYAVFSLLSAVAWSPAVLIVSRVLQGIGSAMLFATGMALLTSVFPPGERGRVLGKNVTAVYLGLALGPFFGGFLTQHFGWRSVFVVNFVLGIVLVAATVWRLRGEWAEAAGESFDRLGTVLYGAMLILLMLGFSRLRSVAGTGLLVTSAAVFVGFVAWELRTKSPVVDLTLFRRNVVFAFSSLAALIHYSATFAVTFVLSLYLQSVRGLSPQGAGAILVAQPIMMALFSPVAGRLSDRIQPRLLASFGMTLTTVGVFLLSFVEPTTSTAVVLAELVLLGFGFAFFSSPNTNAVMSSLEKRHLGVGSGILGTMRLLGQNMSMGIVMMVLALYLGGRQVGTATQREFMHSLRVVFWIFSGLGVAGVVASLARGRVRDS
jgi:EmrB/QacA subfamily drug resistance transporter